MPFFKKTYKESDLIKGCTHNDRRFQEILYKKYFGMSMSIIMYHVKNEEKALDIVNQGFLKVFKNIHKVENPQSLEYWIKTIMMRTRADYFRSNKRYLEAIILSEDDTLNHGYENTSALDNLYYQDIIKMLDHLPSASAQVFQLYAIDGLKHSEIAQTLNISEGTSKWHLSNARKKLKELLEQQYNNQKDAG